MCFVPFRATAEDVGRALGKLNFVANKVNQQRAEIDRDLDGDAAAAALLELEQEVLKDELAQLCERLGASDADFIVEVTEEEAEGEEGAAEGGHEEEAEGEEEEEAVAVGGGAGGGAGAGANEGAQETETAADDDDADDDAAGDAADAGEGEDAVEAAAAEEEAAADNEEPSEEQVAEWRARETVGRGDGHFCVHGHCVLTLRSTLAAPRNSTRVQHSWMGLLTRLLRTRTTTPQSGLRTSKQR